jgi:hypothetical protein
MAASSSRWRHSGADTGADTDTGTGADIGTNEAARNRLRLALAQAKWQMVSSISSIGLQSQSFHKEIIASLHAGRLRRDDSRTFISPIPIAHCILQRQFALNMSEAALAAGNAIDRLYCHQDPYVPIFKQVP